ncbi:hypothetical protein DID75_03555 [Candidatus Marinamargulisbacteria bacterium SCGC AG-410-N11]|nr:hypothetical protein DID75_03555 [Candidatus Marinamargulisbacteria bacterium SCGC AG-410-N11]
MHRVSALKHNKSITETKWVSISEKSKSEDMMKAFGVNTKVPPIISLSKLPEINSLCYLNQQGRSTPQNILDAFGCDIKLADLQEPKCRTFELDHSKQLTDDIIDFLYQTQKTNLCCFRRNRTYQQVTYIINVQMSESQKIELKQAFSNYYQNSSKSNLNHIQSILDTLNFSV